MAIAHVHRLPQHTKQKMAYYWSDNISYIYKLFRQKAYHEVTKKPETLQRRKEKEIWQQS